MEGPTPVSALIHAATMVAAGVFLVARFFPLFQEAREAMMVVALVGGFTAFAAATLGLVMDDIKRVMAYSTISQLGYMMAALGLGAFGPALFHLFTHAFFKALLFLGAGSVNHATGTFNMRYMGGLRRHMPWTYALLLVGGLSLVGIAPLAGFWSKDEIITAAWLGEGPVEPWVRQAVFGLLVAAVLLTAFYTLRMIFLTFHGDFRGGGAQELIDSDAEGQAAPTAVTDEVHLAESPKVMVAPMAVLGIAAALAGYLANPQWVKSLLGIPGHWFSYYVESALLYGHAETAPFNWPVALISTVTALAGIGLAGLVYTRGKSARRTGDNMEAAGSAKLQEGYGSHEPAAEPRHGHEPGPVAPLRPEPLAKAGPVYTLLCRKYFIDELYEGLVVKRVFYRFFAGLTDWLDRNLVDNIVELAAWLTRQLGRLVAQLQTGQVQFYGAVIVLGAVIILVGYLAFGMDMGE
jgi:NADH-quinone oxidoreductase subunit L